MEYLNNNIHFSFLNPSEPDGLKVFRVKFRDLSFGFIISLNCGENTSKAIDYEEVTVFRVINIVVYGRKFFIIVYMILVPHWLSTDSNIKCKHKHLGVKKKEL